MHNSFVHYQIYHYIYIYILLFYYLLLLRRKKKNIFYLFMKWLHGEKEKKALLFSSDDDFAADFWPFLTAPLSEQHIRRSQCEFTGIEFSSESSVGGFTAGAIAQPCPRLAGFRNQDRSVTSVEFVLYKMCPW